MLESKIQNAAINYYQVRGWLVVKILQTTLNGWPDLQIHKEGVTKFIECKAPGKKPGKLQEYRHRQLREAGFIVLVIDYLL